MVLALGIVGAGRTRNGLGPFLATFAERAGGRIEVVVGRDPASGQRQAAALAAQLGHPVAVADGVAAMFADHALDGVIVAAPAAAHLAALQAALAAGVPCLCEKPLVPPAELGSGQQVVAGFRARRLLLMENCQWPFVLPAFTALHGPLAGSVRMVEMGLSPSAPGREMVGDSLSHLLSLAQAVAPVGQRTRVDSALVEATGDAATMLTCRLVDPELTMRLHLRVCRVQPRPAWLALDGVRIDRRIGPDYGIGFAAGERCQAIPDPMGALVYRFASLLEHRDLDRIDALADAIAVRLRLYAEILGRLA